MRRLRCFDEGGQAVEESDGNKCLSEHSEFVQTAGASSQSAAGNCVFIFHQRENGATFGRREKSCASEVARG